MKPVPESAEFAPESNIVSLQQARIGIAEKQHCPIHPPAWEGLLGFGAAVPEDARAGY